MSKNRFWSIIFNNDRFTDSVPSYDIAIATVGSFSLKQTIPYLLRYLLLQSQEVAQAFGAVCTPDFFLFKKVMLFISHNCFDIPVFK